MSWAFQVWVWAVAAGHFVQHHAEGPEIGVDVDAFGEQAFGGGVGDGAAYVGGELSGLFERFGYAEVEHLAFGVVGDLQVRGLQVVV